MNDNGIPGVDSAIPPNSAVSIYQQDGMEEFPVLKAFQQYIDAEQAKARKRLVTMGIFFVILTGAVIAIFVAMLVNLSQRNQTLNDRLVEFAMKERDRQPVIVQPPPADNSALVTALTAKLDSVEQKLAESQKKAEQIAQAARDEAAARAAAEAAKQKGPTAEELEIQRLKTLLAAEREKAAAEKERKRQEELEEYRRRHYPELYQPAAPRQRQRNTARARRVDVGDFDIDDDDSAITYFNEDNDGDDTPPPNAKTKKMPAAKQEKTVVDTEKEAESAPEKPTATYTIPVDVKKPERRWRVPTE